MSESVSDEARDEVVSQEILHQEHPVEGVTERDLPPVSQEELDRLDEPT